ncbi:MAG TPA: methionine--tRNA ligase [Candidatus Dormibacteraeota bacterium]|jgi:methionyl-tRNA synthetase|nr:methionine--tRNA ligase [Candidatus Dormibacteraeota bacterium]
MSKFYVTTAIVYPNAAPHLGFIYELVGTDALARYHRLLGDDTFFLTGTDEHSQNVRRKAEEAGQSTAEFTGRMAKLYREVEAKFGISYDRFIRTEDPDHYRGVQTFIAKMQDRGDIYKGAYEGWYCVSCEAFKTDSELKNGYCLIHPTLKAQWLKEENYFFALSRYQDRLQQHIDKHPDFIQPESRRNEVLGWLKDGLRDFSISRSTIKWGVPFPGDDKHVVYVWGDALVNYITGVGYGTDEEQFKRWWPADLHVIGKDITRFHCLYWPAMLMSAGIAVPKRVFGHGFLTVRGDKMSKSAGNFLDPSEAADRFGVEGTRYLLLREVPFDRDGDISWETMVDRYNADLANDLGNFVYRTLSMMQRYFDGKVPAPDGDSTKLDLDLRKAFEKAIKNLDKHLRQLDFTGALEEIWAAVNRGNKYIEETAPWVLARQSDQRKRLQTVMYNLAEAIRLTSYLTSPFMPETAQKIAALVKADLKAPWATAQQWGGMAPRTQTSQGEILFPRLEKPEPVA